jgi:predicted enzyme related to lactoylglutathione lyase
MSEGIKSVVYPASDLAKAKAMFSAVLNAEPVMDEPYYVGFQVNGTDIGLDPHGHQSGAVVYYHVDDIRGTLQTLVDAGAEVDTDVKDVGGGRQIAAVKDTDGNLIGLLQDA